MLSHKEDGMLDECKCSRDAFTRYIVDAERQLDAQYTYYTENVQVKSNRRVGLANMPTRPKLSFAKRQKAAEEVQALMRKELGDKYDIFMEAGPGEKRNLLTPAVYRKLKESSLCYDCGGAHFARDEKCPKAGAGKSS